MIEAKAFRTFFTIYSLFKSEHLRANIKLTLHKALIISVMTYVCRAWELVADLFKFQFLQNKVLHTSVNFPRCTPVRTLHLDFNVLYVYDYIQKLCRQHAHIIQNHENEHVCNTEHGEARHRKCKRLNLGGDQAYVCSSD
jgi:hypothetical protein